MRVNFRSTHLPRFFGSAIFLCCTPTKPNSLKDYPVTLFTDITRWFYRTIPHFLAATRHTAVIHAISAAAIMDEITHQCRHNVTPGCNCSTKPTRRNRYEVVTWGCSDNIEFGEKEAGRFTEQTGNRTSCFDASEPT